MSLAIDSRHVVGLYALGQWYDVQKGSLIVDAFEFTYWEEDGPLLKDRHDVRHTDYTLGCLYQDLPGATRGTYGENSRGRYASPSGCTGISFIEGKTGRYVSFSMMEVRAFREDKK